MDWEKVIRKHFVKEGYRTQWVRPFLLLWKGRQVRVCYVDLTGCLAAKTPRDIRESFLNLLGHLTRLSQKDGIFKGREMVFQWIVLEEPTRSQRAVLAEAGVETCLFKPFLA
jgi:hypothetical protein